MKLQKFFFVWLLLVSLACSQTSRPESTPTVAPPTSAPTTLSATAIATLPPPATLPPASLPTVSSSPTASSTPTATLPLLPVLNPQQLLTTTSNLQGVILFTSADVAPLSNMGLLPIIIEEVDLFGHKPDLWAVAIDGGAAGRLTNSTAALWLGNGQPQLAANETISVDPTVLHQVALPGTCANPTLEEAFPSRLCHSFAFAPNGQRLAFFTSAMPCANGLMVVNLPAGTSLSYLGGDPSVQNFFFTPFDQLLTFTGACGGGRISVLPATEESWQGLGQQGSTAWNPAGTILTTITDNHAPEQTLWSYNAQTGTQIMASSAELVMQDRPVWTIDNSHFLYRQMGLRLESNGDYTFTPGQIVLVNGQTGEQTNLLDDPAHAYYWCPGGLCNWRGDWLEVSRRPFTPITLPNSINILNEPAVNCYLYEGLCQSASESLWLNWQRGELLPPEQAPLPAINPTPTPIPAGPNLSQEPLLRGANYAFYLGLDSQSLWLVPAGGSPSLWVSNSHDFLYLP